MAKEGDRPRETAAPVPYPSLSCDELQTSSRQAGNIHISSPSLVCTLHLDLTPTPMVLQASGSR